MSNNSSTLSLFACLVPDQSMADILATESSRITRGNSFGNSKDGLASSSQQVRYNLVIKQQRNPKQFKITDFSSKKPLPFNQKLRLPLINLAKPSAFENRDKKRRQRGTLPGNLTADTSMTKIASSSVDSKPWRKIKVVTNKLRAKTNSKKTHLGSVIVERSSSIELKHKMMAKILQVDKTKKNVFANEMRQTRIDNQFYEYRSRHCDMLASLHDLPEDDSKTKKKKKPKLSEKPNYLGRFKKKQSEILFVDSSRLPSTTRAAMKKDSSMHLAASVAQEVYSPQKVSKKPSINLEGYLEVNGLSTDIGKDNCLYQRDYLMKHVAKEFEDNVEDSSRVLRYKKYYLDSVREIMNSKKSIPDFDRDIKDKLLVLKNKSLHLDWHNSQKSKPVLFLDIDGTLIWSSISTHKSDNNKELVMDKGLIIFVHTYLNIDRCQNTTISERVSINS